MEFKIGDVIEIVVPGHTYSGWEEKFIELGFKKTGMLDNNLNHFEWRGKLWIVFNSFKHEGTGDEVYAIRCLQSPNRELLIGKDGIIHVDLKNSIEYLILQIEDELNNEKV